MKRWIRRALLLLVLLLGICNAYAADAPVSNLDVRVTVDAAGNAAVTVNVTVERSDASESVRLPLSAQAKNLSVTGGDFQKKTENGATYLMLKDASAQTGSCSYTLSYTLKNLVTVNADRTQTIDLELVNAFWPQEIPSVSFSVSMPKEFDAKRVYRSGYYGEELTVTESVEGTEIRGSTQSALLDHESIALQMQLPSGYFRLAHQPGAMGRAALIVMAFVALLGLVYWYQTLRNSLPPRRSRPYLPDGIGAWEFPCVAGCGSADFFLLLQEWASLGYLSIHRTRRGRVVLTQQMPMETERRAVERRAFQALFRRDFSCYADTARVGKIAQRTQRAAQRYWNRRLFSGKSGNPRLLRAAGALCLGLAWMWAMDHLLPAWTLRAVLILLALALGTAGGVLLERALQGLLSRQRRALLPALAVLLLSAVLAQKSGGWGSMLLGLLLLAGAVLGTRLGGKRSAAGLEWAGQIRAFRSHLKRLGIHHLRLMLDQDPQYFYVMLPYAEAMGLGAHFAKGFANIALEPCAWISGLALPDHTAMTFYKEYKALCAKIRRGAAGVRRTPRR